MEMEERISKIEAEIEALVKMVVALKGVVVNLIDAVENTNNYLASRNERG